MSSNTPECCSTHKKYAMEPSLTGKLWELQEPDEHFVNAIMRHANVAEILARLIALRVSSVDEVQAFLTPTLRDSLPDPLVLQGMENAILRVVQAITEEESLLIWGDYDVDGITATALLLQFFAKLGRRIPFYVPSRVHGYGATQKALAEVWIRTNIPKVILMVDCGITAHETLAQLKDCGVDVIVLDHHSPGHILPPAHTLVDPHLPGNPKELQKICAAGLVFLFLVGLNRVLRIAIATYKEPDLRFFLDLVALGTVCDVMPLVGLNRAYVAQGLKILTKQQNLGLRALSNIANIKTSFLAYHLAFVFGPRLNAPGRLHNADPSIHLLTAQTEEDAEFWALELDRLNQKRRILEDEVLKEALPLAESQRDRPFLLICGNNWSTGVLGIIAGRLKEHFGKPCCVISFDETGLGRGSGRSVPGLDLGAFIHQAKDAGLLEEGGGHALAAGFSLQRTCLADFEALLIKATQKIIGEPTSVMVDSILSLSGATPDFVQLINRLAPFGRGNSAPLFLFSNVCIEYAKIIGRNHISCIVSQNDGMRLPAVAFRSVGTALGEILLAHDGLYNIVGALEMNTWKGKVTVQIYIEDARRG
ncbi:MAG: single-stranded-DNA-specific exonuclease RecJ [Holosporales bacterium]|nr:single-stranded-DNA-specific exonuclease RecJ [Holosporales bacterium]